MQVKIGDKIYDSNYEAVMIVLSDEDKKNIRNMGNSTKYCSYPDNVDPAFISKWDENLGRAERCF